MKHPAARSSWAGELILVLLISWIARGIFMYLMPVGVHGVDMDYWEEVGKVMLRGENPYQVTGRLNYPPFWMQINYVLMLIHVKTGVSFIRVLQVFLIGCESIATAVLFRILRRVVPNGSFFKLVLLGIALNPYCILLVCMHGNFDIFLVIWILLFIDQLLEFRSSGVAIDWLWASLFLGVGVLAKIVPIVLVPLLAAQGRALGRKTMILGGVLALFPVLLGLSIIYVLSPEQVTEHVLKYRSIQGWGGATGLLVLIHKTPWIAAYARMFTLALVPLLALVTVWLWRRPGLSDCDVCLAAALLLAALPLFGSGYSTQYLYWFLPLLIVTYDCYGNRWKILLRLTLMAGAIVSFCEYAFFPTHGAFLIRAYPKSKLLDVIDSFVKLRSGQTEVRLPLYVMLVLVELIGIYMLTRRGVLERHGDREQMGAQH